MTMFTCWFVIVVAMAVVAILVLIGFLQQERR